MKVKLIFDAQFVGRLEEIVDVPDELVRDDVRSLFPAKLGVVYDDNCSFEIVSEEG